MQSVSQEMADNLANKYITKNNKDAREKKIQLSSKIKVKPDSFLSRSSNPNINIELFQNYKIRIHQFIKNYN